MSGRSGVDAGIVLLRLSRVICQLYFLSLLATVRGGTSFLFPPRRKRNRSKENASQPSAIRNARLEGNGLDRIAEVGQAFEQTLDSFAGVVVAEVLGSQVSIFDAVAQHMVRGREHG